MTPEGKLAVNRVIEQHDAVVKTEILEGEDRRFVTIVANRPADDALNALDDVSLMHHSGAGMKGSRECGRPLLRVMTIAGEFSSPVIYLEDLNVKRSESHAWPLRDKGVADNPAPVIPSSVWQSGGAEVYPEGHPSRPA